MSTILVMEHDSSFREALAETLVTNGYDVACSINQDECENHASAEPKAFSKYFLVIMDVFLPRREDFDMLQTLKEKFPGIKIIATSENKASCRAEVSLNVAALMGADASLKKPLAMEKVLRTIKYLETSVA